LYFAQQHDQRSPTAVAHGVHSFEFKPPLVRPIRLGTDPFLKGWRRCDGLLNGSRRSSAGAA
jgi:hypothetical protein